MNGAFFTTDDGSWFQPTDMCRGPWDPQACHAGPPAGLLARASERLVPEQHLVRLTVDLTRPIPHAGFSIAGTVTRAGRTVSTTEMTIINGDGRAIVTARGMHLAGADHDEMPTTHYDTPRLSRAQSGRFPLPDASEGIGHGLPMFDSGVDVLYPPGDTPEPGPTRMWMRTVPLLAGEAPSGFQKICPLADCGNAVSRNADPRALSFVNTDLTVVLHRSPVGDWLGTDSVSRWEASGIGMSDSLLFDEYGAVGRALQSLLISPLSA